MAEAGWHPDPSGRHQQRYFDGYRWTEHIADGQVLGKDPVYSPPTRPAVDNTPVDVPKSDAAPTSRSPVRAAAARYSVWPLWAKIAAPVGALLVVGGAVDAVTPERKENAPIVIETDESPTTVEVTTTMAPTTTSTSSTTTSTTTTSTTSTTTTTTTAAPPPPPPTTRAPLPPPSLAPQSTLGDCHPSYDPCVPYASDVDCRGGSGNGPVYTGRVRVIGPDVYDLDRDGDGIGCE